jgi:plasmid stabilization system protein ParE
MTVEYSKRAVADLLSIAVYYEEAGAPGIGERITRCVDEVVARIITWPRSGKLVAEEHGLRVVPLVQFPYLLFYELTASGVIQILHIRHAARRPWSRSSERD